MIISSISRTLCQNFNFQVTRFGKILPKYKMAIYGENFGVCKFSELWIFAEK